jgi:FPC/CPF motif-containing protein YcgG
MLFPVVDDVHPLADRFRDFIAASEFPCVGAKSALSRHQMRVLVARDVASSWDDLRIYAALLDFAAQYRADPVLFQSFAVVFDGVPPAGEAEFEHYLWERVQSLSDKDVWYRNGADPRVSSDPDNPHFSLSFGGEGFFVVGLHPAASRPARRFERPVLVFNLHDQFERLREDGRYDRLRATILDRDLRLAGTANPMLARHGQSSEARQYSGRKVDEDWACPFNRVGTDRPDGTST